MRTTIAKIMSVASATVAGVFVFVLKGGIGEIKAPNEFYNNK
ncbi:hypothetical protein [Paenibacillus elgii]|nr:hypothetical protein [Paenibacillus elgii]